MDTVEAFITDNYVQLVTTKSNVLLYCKSPMSIQLRVLSLKYLWCMTKIIKLHRCIVIQLKKHLGILSPSDNNNLIVEMYIKMAEADFQKVVYPCCGLVEVQKWSIQHNKCYGSYVERRIIETSAQNCPTCDEYCRGTIQLVWHMERHYGDAVMFACILCRNPYATNVALDWHVALNHGAIGDVRWDYERKYNLVMH